MLLLSLTFPWQPFQNTTNTGALLVPSHLMSFSLSLF